MNILIWFWSLPVYQWTKNNENTKNPFRAVCQKNLKAFHKYIGSSQTSNGICIREIIRKNYRFNKYIYSLPIHQTVRLTGFSRHHSGLIEAPLKFSEDHSTMVSRGLRRVLNWVPIMLRNSSFSDSRCISFCLSSKQIYIEKSIHKNC